MTAKQRGILKRGLKRMPADESRHRYFSTSIPGAGIFLPIARAIKRSSPVTSIGSVPATPTTPSMDQFSVSEQDERTPPTPSVAPSKFGQSVSGRAPSPALRPKSRPSLPRPESPLRRAQAAPGATPGTIGGRPSLSTLSSNRLGGSKYAASPTPAKTASKTPAKTPNFSASVRGVPGHGTRSPSRLGRDDGDEVAQLKAALKEKNEKIAMITAEFDSHRADFRSTLDTLELASTETERVYEKRVEDLLEERRMLLAQGEDVESVAQQLRQLEEVVQELEEGLEDARRGEAEARGEVEFLRGEVERVRAELRREREKNATIANGVKDHTPAPRAPSPALASPPAGTGVSSPTPAPATTAAANMSPPREQAPAASDAWCALCEQDGHDSISCPYDN